MRVHSGSILDAGTEAIVNPANSFLNHAGGLAAVIDKAAQGLHYGAYSTTLHDGVKRLRREAATSLIDFPLDPERPQRLSGFADYIYDEVGKAWMRESREAPLIATGNVHATGSGHLAERGIKAVIHAVGPIYNGGHFCEASLLISCVIESISAAEEQGCRSIAIPAISCGIFGYPPEKAIRLIVDAAWNYRSEPEVVFAAFEPEHAALFQAAIDQHEANHA